ncbi:MAG: PEF-CTERM sorting domain-containing protein [Methanophagales archaeon]|nr:PEF-CTERM sorting domain-containing protein [Methanophagales archaeon]
MKKMRKAKVITALAMTVVMLVAMTGIAAAEATVCGWVFLQDQTTKVSGANVNVYSDSDHINRVGSGETDVNGWYSVSCGSLTAGNTAYVTASTDDGKSGESEGAVKYVGEGVYEANIAVVIVELGIPEFATIAIPVAAILGLLFFFNHRKRKKE